MKSKGEKAQSSLLLRKTHRLSTKWISKHLRKTLQKSDLQNALQIFQQKNRQNISKTTEQNSNELEVSWKHEALFLKTEERTFPP